MKFGTLKSIGHNIADSLGTGVGLMINVHEMDIFAEAAATPERYIEVDFLTGETSGGHPSPALAEAIQLYSKALPDLCRRQGGEIADFSRLQVRFSGCWPDVRFVVSVEDRNGRRSTDEYEGGEFRRPRVRDSLGRLRPQRST
jgi:hypothetical protein